MRKKELKILGLSYSQSQIGSYVIILAEKRGERKLPLIIKPSEAQRIALELEGIKSPRPMTHDVIKTICDSFDLEIKEVCIHTLAEGIFYTKFVLSNGAQKIDVDCSGGDAIALSVIFKCPIYASTSVLDAAGIIINDDGSIPEHTDEPINEDDEMNIEDLDAYYPTEESKRIVSIEDLEQMMNQAIENEEYEIAAEIRDRIQLIKDKNQNK